MEQSKEPLLQHKVIARPRAKVVADLCELDNRTLFVITDYFSNFIEVARINSVTSRSVIKEIKSVFARYGIPDVLVTALNLQPLNSQCLRNPGCFNTSHPPLTTHSPMGKQITQLKR